MTQTEEVQFKLDGLILLTEGIGRAKADGKPILNALVIVSYGDETGAYRMRAFNDGRFMETAHFSQRFGAGYAIASRSRTQSQVAARSAQEKLPFGGKFKRVYRGTPTMPAFY